MGYHFSRLLKSFLLFLLIMISLRVFSQEDAASFIDISYANVKDPVCSELNISHCSHTNSEGGINGSFYYATNKHPYKKIDVKIKWSWEHIESENGKRTNFESGEESSWYEMKPGDKFFLCCAYEIVKSGLYLSKWKNLYPTVVYAKFME